jgi:hypothetical protein
LSFAVILESRRRLSLFSFSSFLFSFFAPSPENTQPSHATHFPFINGTQHVSILFMATQRDAPRAYQQAVANRAIEGNVIAVSDTGSGKTLISVILLKHMVAKARQEAKQTGRQVGSCYTMTREPLSCSQSPFTTVSRKRNGRERKAWQWI